MATALIVTGDRNANTEDWYDVVKAAVLSFGWDTVVIEGGGRGIDAIAADVAYDHNLTLETYRADWDTYKKAAGPRRNGQMLERLLWYRDQGHGICVLAFHDDLPNAKGTGDMVKKARGKGVKVIRYRHVDEDDEATALGG